MIIKSYRVPVKRTRLLANYLSSPGENESVGWVRGSQESVEISAEISRLSGGCYGVRHVIVAPECSFEGRDLELVLEEFALEFGLSDCAVEAISVAQHDKRRAGGQASRHWHLCIGEYDVGRACVLDSRFTKVRDEKTARICELRSGEPLTPGRFNWGIYDRLERERPELDLERFRKALEAAAVDTGMKKTDWKQFRARSAYLSTAHLAHNRRLLRAAQRTGVEIAQATLPEIRHRLRSMASELGPDALVRRLVLEGFELVPGSNANGWRLLGQGVDLGALDRLSGLPADEIDAAIVADLPGPETS